MPTKTWVVGEEVLAADFNTYVQRQVVPTFPNAAARNAAIPSPTVGMLSLLTDTQILQQYTDKTGTPGWLKPWGQPWGWVQSKALSKPSVGPGVFVVDGSDFTLPYPNRSYQFMISMTCNVTTVSSPMFQIQIGPTPNGVHAQHTINAAWWARVTYGDEFTYSPGQTNTGILTCNQDAGQINISWGRMVIVDAGPAA